MDDFIKTEETNINTSWLKNIYSSLERLQNAERICKDGAGDIMEYLQTDPAYLPTIQFTSLKMMVTEMRILLNNVRVKIKPEFFESSMTKINVVQKYIDTRPQALFKNVVNQQNHSNQSVLTDFFYTVVNDMSVMRAEIVNMITGLLFIIGDEKPKGMDKLRRMGN